jgi:predicted RNase H-like HicB family nuclease
MSEALMKYVYIIEKAADGSYSAYVPDLPGCTTSGDSPDEIRHNIKDAVDTYIESLRENNEPVPPPSTSVDVVEAA